MNKKVELGLNEIKNILLEEMDYIDKFCKKNDISYFLIGGSLLGAVRHKGFIPWDDDIDIGMLREDYNKFLRLFNDPRNIYKKVDVNNTKGYYLPFAKVIDTRTIMIEEVKNSIELGVGIDIFPFDNLKYGKKKIFSQIEIYRKILIIKNLSIRKERKFIKNIIVRLFQTFFAIISKERLIKKIDMLAKEYCREKGSKYVGELVYMPYGKREIYEREWVEQTIKLEFENYEFNVPKNYDKFLKKTFLEYMELPPKEKQITHHNFKCYRKN